MNSNTANISHSQVIEKTALDEITQLRAREEHYKKRGEDYSIVRSQIDDAIDSGHFEAANALTRKLSKFE